MPTAKANEFLVAAKALSRELASERFRPASLPLAFIRWYIRARYGEDAKYEITDGPGDGGVDALVEEGPITVVLQFKYESSKKLKLVTRSEVSAFEAMAARFHKEDQATAFNTWIDSVRQTLRSRYRQIRLLALSSPHLVRFDFVTTKRVNYFVAEQYNIVDIDRLAPLWFLYEEGFTPPVETIDIEFEKLWSTGSVDDPIKNYVGLADVRVFLKLMDRDQTERLFAQNVRTDLRSRINRLICDTYERTPETFWLGNNGLYVVCSRANQIGNTLRLVYPSIINGSQTLHALHSARVRPACRILVRVLQMDTVGQRPLLNAIVRRTNTQNPMKVTNLAAHEVEQLFIARYLDGLQIFYERREKEWKNEKRALLDGYMPVSMKEVAQWAAVTYADVGAGTARARVGTLFGETNYNNIFGIFGAALGSSQYRRLASSVYAGLVVKNFIRRLPPGRRREKAAHLVLVRGVYEAIERYPSLGTRVPELLRSRKYKLASRGFVSAINDTLRSLLREQLRAERTGEATDLSNFFKRDDLTTRAFKKVLTRKQLILVGKNIAKEVGL